MPRLKVTVFVALFSATVAWDACAADISPIVGFWSPVKETCSGTDDHWDIKQSGASYTEELCTLISSTRKGERFSLRQNCAVEGTEEIRTNSFTLLKSGQLQVGKRRYKRCPRPESVH